MLLSRNSQWLASFLRHFSWSKLYYSSKKALFVFLICIQISTCCLQLVCYYRILLWWERIEHYSRCMPRWILLPPWYRHQHKLPVSNWFLQVRCFERIVCWLYRVYIRVFLWWAGARESQGKSRCSLCL